VSALTEKEKTVFINYVVDTPKEMIAKQVGATTQNLSQVANRVNSKIKDTCSSIFVAEKIDSSDLDEVRLLVIRRLISQLRPFLIFEELEVS
jgi:transcriptional regulator